MTRRDARIAMELVRMARFLAMTSVLDQGSVTMSGLQAAVNAVVGDWHVKLVDIDVLLDGVDFRGREYRSREDTASLKGPSAKYRKGEDVIGFLYKEFDTGSLFMDYDQVDDITPTCIRCTLRDGTVRSIRVVGDPK